MVRVLAMKRMVEVTVVTKKVYRVERDSVLDAPHDVSRFEQGKHTDWCVDVWSNHTLSVESRPIEVEEDEATE